MFIFLKTNWRIFLWLVFFCWCVGNFGGNIQFFLVYSHSYFTKITTFLQMHDKNLFLLLQKNRQEAADVLERPSLKGVRYSVVEKYSEQAHFIYELLQNADDAKAKKVSFILSKDGLIFIHDGVIKFDVTDPNKESDPSLRIGHINAITSIGNSSKSEDEAQIGKFGVGFKSVFQYTNNPEIYEDDYKFCIERFIVPILKENDHPLRKKEETLFFFPFNNSEMLPEQAYSDISNKFIGLENPLMFIQSLETIKWSTIDNQGEYSKINLKQEYWNNLTIDTFETYEKNGSSENKLCFLRFTEIIKEKPTLSTIITFAINQENIVQHNKYYFAYCFFSTREVTNLKFIIQAPFLMIDNRQGIKRGNSWNELLINQLSDLLVKTIDFFQDKKLIDDNWFNVLPIDKDLFEQNSLFYPFYEKTKLALLEKSILPTKEKTLTRSQYAYIADNERLLQLLSSEQLSSLLNQEAHWIFPSLAGTRRRKDVLGSYLFEEIGVRDLPPRFFIKSLTDSFLSKQSDEWLIEFYKYVSTSSFLWDDLRKKPIIRTTDNKHFIPFNNSNELTVFLPSPIPTSFPTVKAIFIEDEIVKKLFDSLGLKEPDLEAEIELEIIPLYKKGQSISFEENFEYVKMFIAYYEKIAAHEQNKFIAKIKDLAIIEATDSLDGVKQLVKPNLVYGQTEKLDTFFNGYKDKIYWIEKKFYNKLKIFFGKDILNSFLWGLGYITFPRQIVKNISISAENKQKLAIKVPYFTQEYYIYDYHIEGLDNAVNTEINYNKSKIIWNLLVNSFKFHKLKTKGEYSYFYYTVKIEYFDAEYIKFLRTRPWLFKKDSTTAVSPKNITINQLTENDYDIKGEGALKLMEALFLSNKEVVSTDVLLDENEKKELFRKAKEYEEYEEFIKIIPRSRLEQVLKEEKILQKKNQDNKHFGIIPDKTKYTGDIDVISKEDLLAELYKIRSKENEEDMSSEAILKKQKQELANLQRKIETTPLVENNEQKIRYANLMNLRDFSIELSHVIKTALSKAMNQALFFKEEFPNAEFENMFKIYSQEMYYELQRLRRVVDFMLSYTEAEKYYEPIDIAALIKYLFQSLHKKEIEQENIFVDLNLNTSITISYNRKSFEDIISNLITNSIKALKGSNEKKIKCSTFMNQDDKEFVILFSDSGHGVDGSIKNRIFDAYVTTTQEYGGAGVGLYIVKMKLQSLGGYIELVESELTSGASFKVVLPLN